MEPLVDTVIEDPRWEDILPPLADSAARATLAELSLDPEWLREIDLHIHVPKHGTPKDGPSAGITIDAANGNITGNTIDSGPTLAAPPARTGPHPEITSYSTHAPVVY